VATRFSVKVNWLLGHLNREMTTSEVSLPEVDLVARLDRAIDHRSRLSADRATRRELAEHGFVTGTVQGVPGSVSLRLTCYRPRTWLGWLGVFFGDQDKLAKPVLKGRLSGDEQRTEVCYRVDAFGTAVSALVFVTLGISLVLAGAIVSLVHPMPMPSIGSALWIPGAVLLGFALLIWRAVDSAILDEQYLTDWLQITLG
jgi:uncharacterized membrane protein YidH (DUF202 family)